ncbi:hypothetical protein FQR65_LT20977 [Abscondita terminalis]|nr:hypothetical protein FQR65_LT20977 [Abscondita terminalis]
MPASSVPGLQQAIVRPSPPARPRHRHDRTSRQASGTPSELRASATEIGPDQPAQGAAGVDAESKRSACRAADAAGCSRPDGVACPSVASVGRAATCADASTPAASADAGRAAWTPAKEASSARDRVGVALRPARACARSGHARPGREGDTERGDRTLADQVGGVVDQIAALSSRASDLFPFAAAPPSSRLRCPDKRGIGQVALDRWRGRASEFIAREAAGRVLQGSPDRAAPA